MLKFLVASVLFSLAWVLPVQATEAIALSFEIASTPQTSVVGAVNAPTETGTATETNTQPTSSTAPTPEPTTAAATPTPEPAAEAEASPNTPAPSPPSPTETAEANPDKTPIDKPATATPPAPPQEAIALSFTMPQMRAARAVAVAKALKAPAPTDNSVEAGDTIFDGGSDSLVARTVGHAEGTRTADGSKTRAYYGHSDPGNGVWNRGSFSYQHEASSPEDADEKQLARLKRQNATLRQKAAARQLTMSLEEELNGIDLANQAPLAALDTGGYVERLQEARDRGLTGSDAVLWARTQSYRNPRTQAWEAPGLGNTEANISHDQNRRLTAVARATAAVKAQRQARQTKPQSFAMMP